MNAQIADAIWLEALWQLYCAILLFGFMAAFVIALWLDKRNR